MPLLLPSNLPICIWLCILNRRVIIGWKWALILSVKSSVLIIAITASILLIPCARRLRLSLYHFILSQVYLLSLLVILILEIVPCWRFFHTLFKTWGRIASRPHTLSIIYIVLEKYGILSGDVKLLPLFEWGMIEGRPPIDGCGGRDGIVWIISIVGIFVFVSIGFFVRMRTNIIFESFFTMFEHF